MNSSCFFYFRERLYNVMVAHNQVLLICTCSVHLPVVIFIAGVGFRYPCSDSIHKTSVGAEDSTLSFKAEVVCIITLAPG